MCFATYFLHIRSFFSYPPSPLWNGSTKWPVCSTASRVGLCCRNLSISGENGLISDILFTELACITEVAAAKCLFDGSPL